MAFNLFGKQQSNSQPKKSAVDLVKSMRDAGQSNDQIVQTLQRDGYTAAEVFDAVQIADTHQSFSQPSEHHTMDAPQNPMSYQPQSIIGNDSYGQFPPPSFPPMQQSSQAPPIPSMAQMAQASGSSDADSQQIEALIEAVIEEKWRDIERNISKVVEWKESTEQKIQAMQQQLIDLKSQMDSLQKAVVGKIGDYDKNILQVGAQLGAMEKAFSQVLPTFTENINELNRITQRLKK